MCGKKIHKEEQSGVLSLDFKLILVFSDPI